MGKYEDLARRVILYRARHRLSQAEFAELAGVSRTTISHLESAPQKMKLRKITVLRIEDAMAE